MLIAARINRPGSSYLATNATGDQTSSASEVTATDITRAAGCFLKGEKSHR